MLDGKIPLGQVSGRIDHLGIDLKRHSPLLTRRQTDGSDSPHLPTRQIYRSR
jgi:hypothetical protein